MRKRRKQKFVDVGTVPVALDFSFLTYRLTFKVLLKRKE